MFRHRRHGRCASGQEIEKFVSLSIIEDGLGECQGMMDMLDMLDMLAVSGSVCKMLVSRTSAIRLQRIPKPSGTGEKPVSLRTFQPTRSVMLSSLIPISCRNFSFFGAEI